MFAISKASDLSSLVLGGQLYWAFPFCKVSLIWCMVELKKFLGPPLIKEWLNEENLQSNIFSVESADFSDI